MDTDKAVEGGAMPFRPALEEWRRVPISPYQNYEVSSLGCVRRDGRVLAPVDCGFGYLACRIVEAHEAAIREGKSS